MSVHRVELGTKAPASAPNLSLRKMCLNGLVVGSEVGDLMGVRFPSRSHPPSTTLATTGETCI